MGRVLNHLNTVLNAVFIVSAAGAAVFAVLCLVKGPTLHYVPYVLAFCAVYYLGTAVKVLADGGRHSAGKGLGLLLLVLVLAALTVITYGSVA